MKKTKKKSKKSNSKVVKIKNNLNVANTISTKKLRAMLLTVFILLIILLFRLAWLKFVDGEKLQKKAYEQQTLTETISAKRGSIYDSTGAILAVSYDADNVIVNLDKITDENRSKIITELCTVLELEQESLNETFNNNTGKTIVAKKVTQEKVDELKKWTTENKLTTTIYTEETTSRYYPYSTLASNVIGFCGTDGQGLNGIEYSWDTLLTGTAGKSVSSKDASQAQIANTEETYIPAENGYNLSLTIDVNIQSIVEKYLKQAVIDNDCKKGGNAIVMDPSTGDILAMASYPDYDLNTPFTPNISISKDWDKLTNTEKSNALYSMWNNKCVTDTYEPGSVFKTITAAIALEENIVEVDKPGVFYCSGVQKVADRDIQCWRTTPHQSESLRDAYNNSCNPAFIQLGMKIGAELSYKYYDAFGFFSKTGVALSGESSGIFFNIKDVGPVQLATMSFGQRFTITPLQMITSISAIVNDGILMEPRIVKSVTNTDTGEITTVSPTQVRQVVSKKTSETIKSMMQSEVEVGTGKRAAVSGYTIGGKTGTSEPTASNQDAGYVASFCGIGPIEDTKIVVLVNLYDPQGESHQGGQIAAPVVADIFSKVLPYLGVPSNAEGSNEVNTTSDNNLY